MLQSVQYGSLRLKPETIEFLKELREAFEASYGKKFTMDEFIRQMAASVEEGDPGVWELYCLKVSQKEELEKKIEEVREKKGK